jgi:signal transduction histidine kinase
VTGHDDGAAAREPSDRPGIGELAFKFLDSMPVAVFIALPGGQPLYANPEAVRLLGRAAIPSASAVDLAETYQISVRGTGTRYPNERLTVVAALAGYASTRDDMEVHQPDGTVVPLQTWGAPVTGPDGAIQYAIAAFVDVSERIRAAEALRASEDRFRATMEILPDGFVFFSAVRDGGGNLVDFRYDYMNEAGWRISRRVREETLGRNLTEVVPESLANGFFAAYARVAATGEPLVLDDVDYEGNYGGRRVIRAFDIRVMKLADGIVVTWRDVLDRRQAEETLSRQAADLQQAATELEQRVEARTAELERSNRELEDFSYSVAHDLRSPLRAIHGYSQILLDEHAARLDPDGQLLLANIGHYTERMNQLIEGLLTLAGVGRRGIEQVSVDMTALAESVAASLREDAADGSPAVAVTVTVGRLAEATGDPRLLRQVWANLISNAMKFCAGQPAGQVTVECERTGGEAIYRVRDNGVGFDMAYVGKLFGVFQRLHAGDFPGTGIGLAIVARIVTRHGGRVWAEGRVNGGACFSFALPVLSPGPGVPGDA